VAEDTAGLAERGGGGAGLVAQRRRRRREQAGWRPQLRPLGFLPLAAGDVRRGGAGAAEGDGAATQGRRREALVQQRGRGRALLQQRAVAAEERTALLLSLLDLLALPGRPLRQQLIHSRGVFLPHLLPLHCELAHKVAGGLAGGLHSLELPRVGLLPRSALLEDRLKACCDSLLATRAVVAVKDLRLPGPGLAVPGF